MKKRIISCVNICIIAMSVCSINQISAKNLEHSSMTKYEATMRQDLLCLMMAYPGCIAKIEKNINGNVYIVMKSGKKVLYDDRKVKNFTQKLDNPDMQDMLEQLYPISGRQILQNANFDPGRRRVYSFFNEIYGNSKTAIQSKLTGVKISSSSYSFNSNDGAADALSNTMKALVSMAQKQKNIYEYVFPISGTFNYRAIAGTNQLSAHSYGIAIDLAANNGGSGYWRWVSSSEGKRKIMAYPSQIVKIFEKNNFIWGGKWAHFDIMHFEYRPELILKAKYFDQGPRNGNFWYYKFPYKDKTVKKYMSMINAAFKK